MAAIKKSFQNAFDKASLTSYWKTESVSGVGVNPFSGVSVQLSPLELTIYNWCTRWYRRYESGSNTEVPVSTYDNMRYYFLALNSRAYMDLLD